MQNYIFAFYYQINYVRVTVWVKVANSGTCLVYFKSVLASAFTLHIKIYNTQHTCLLKYARCLPTIKLQLRRTSYGTDESSDMIYTLHSYSYINGN